MGSGIGFIKRALHISRPQDTEAGVKKPGKTGFFAGRTAKEVDAYQYMTGSKERYKALAHNHRVKARNAASKEFRQAYERKATEYDGKASSAKSENKLKQEQRGDVREDEVLFQEQPASDANPVGKFIGNLANGVRRKGEAMVRDVKAIPGKATLGLLKAGREEIKWSEHPLDRFFLECKILQQRVKNRWS